jgi:hypothetical protein
MEGLDAIIEQLERQKEAIERALEALQWVGGTVGSPAPAGNARSVAQKARWAAKRQGKGPAPKKPTGLTAAGRKRLADNMRKRWAAKRTAEQAKKRGRKAA